MFPSPRRVAARYTKRGGIIQAPPAMVKAISAWVMSSVAATQLVEVEERAKESRDEVRARTSLKPVIREVRNAISSGVKVRALYNMVAGEGGLWEQALILGWYNDAYGSRPKFTAFSKQYKAGNTWLMGKLDSMADFVAGRDFRTVNDRENTQALVEDLKGYLVRGGKTPLKAGGRRRCSPSPST